MSALADADDAGALVYLYCTAQPNPQYLVRPLPSGRERALAAADVAGYVVGACDAAGVPTTGLRGLRPDLDAAPPPPPQAARPPARGAAAPPPPPPHRPGGGGV